MPFIVVGRESAQALLEVPTIPKNGDTMTIREKMLISGITDNCIFLIDETFRFTDEGTIHIQGKGIFLRFGLENIRQ